MAYPFNRPPSFAEFKETLNTKYDCSYEKGCQMIIKPDNPFTIYYFKREAKGTTLTYVCENMDNDQLMSWHLIRSICKHLDIPYEKDGLFGLHLG